MPAATTRPATAAGLALEEPGVPEAARKRMLRIKETAGDVNELVMLLLALAKDPARLADSRESIPLHALLPQLVRDHAHLASGKQISVVVDELPECEVHAPLQLVKSAIGNLLRNAIENVHEGEVRVGLRADGLQLIARLCEHLGWSAGGLGCRRRHPDGPASAPADPAAKRGPEDYAPTALPG